MIGVREAGVVYVLFVLGECNGLNWDCWDGRSKMRCVDPYVDYN